MLNPYLNLNKRLFEESVEKVAIRDGFGQALIKLGEINPNVVVLTADLSESTRTEEFAKRFPERFFEVGVAEQNLAAVATGLAISGKIPFISSYAVFSPGKNLETVRTTIAYNNANVKIAGHHSGIATGEDGATHQATEDLAIMRSLPGMNIFTPCDAIEAKKATLASVDINGPVYLRFSRQKSPVITTTETPFASNKAQAFWTAENPQVTIFTTGYILYHALLAAKNLETQGINVLVANIPILKPIDEQTIIEMVKKTGAVVTCEDHQIMGGLGGTIAEILAKNLPTPIEFIGLQNVFGQSGTSDELLKFYKMDEISIQSAVKKALSRK